MAPLSLRYFFVVGWMRGRNYCFGSHPERFQILGVQREDRERNPERSAGNSVTVLAHCAVYEGCLGCRVFR